MPDVVTAVEANPKRPNTGAWHRYQEYRVGRTKSQLLDAGLTLRDIAWDTKQGHVVFAHGEENPALAPSGTRATTVAGGTAARSASPPADTPAQPSSPQVSPGTPRVLREPVRVVAAGHQGCDAWARTADGRVLWRTCDRPSHAELCAIIVPDTGVLLDHWEPRADLEIEEINQ